jgi:2'-5' RNA ligase
MRLFIALDIDENIRERIAGFIDGLRQFAPDVRWARPESLHVTLKFIGERAESDLPHIQQALENIQAEAFEVTFRGYGFFPTARAARVLWAGIEASPALVSLAEGVDAGLEALAIAKERKKYSPHLTLARTSGGSGSPRRQKEDRPHQRFQRLQAKLEAMPTPEFGAMSAGKFFLYRSQLSPDGSKYTKLVGFTLR